MEYVCGVQMIFQMNTCLETWIQEELHVENLDWFF